MLALTALAACRDVGDGSLPADQIGGCHIDSSVVMDRDDAAVGQSAEHVIDSLDGSTVAVEFDRVDESMATESFTTTFAVSAPGMARGRDSTDPSREVKAELP